MTTIDRALDNVTKVYKCDFCGEEYSRHREAVKCADRHLTEDQDRIKIE